MLVGLGTVEIDARRIPESGWRRGRPGGLMAVVLDRADGPGRGGHSRAATATEGERRKV
jgi:hypothetical protein